MKLTVEYGLYPRCALKINISTKDKYVYQFEKMKKK